MKHKMESIEAICKDRRERTVKLMLDSEGRPYGRKDVIDGLLQAVVPGDSIEALGVRERNVDWQVILKSTAARNRLVQLQELEIKGKTAFVNGKSSYS